MPQSNVATRGSRTGVAPPTRPPNEGPLRVRALPIQPSSSHWKRTAWTRSRARYIFCELSPRLTLLTASDVLLGSCLYVTALRQHLLARAVKLFWQRAQRGAREACPSPRRRWTWLPPPRSPLSGEERVQPEDGLACGKNLPKFVATALTSELGLWPYCARVRFRGFYRKARRATRKLCRHHNTAFCAQLAR